MATYLELYNIKDDPSYGDFAKKVAVAVAIKANAVAGEATPTAEKQAWARTALQSPDAQRQIIENYIFAEYNAQSVSAIMGSTDAQIQTAVDAAVDTLLGV